MKTIDHFNFAGKKALIRVDFNVPLDEKFTITDDTRIRAALPTIQKIIRDGGSVILMSHLGRPKHKPEEKYSLKHIVNHTGALLGKTIRFVNDCVGSETQKTVEAIQPGEILLLENLRFHKEEEEGNEAFAKELAQLGDIYVNDAFGTAHRAHASTTIVANYFPAAKCFGYLMAGEVNSIHKVLNQAEKPFTAIIGGAKVSDKILIIEQLMEKADNIIIGGGMAFTFWKAMGKTIGKSLCEPDKLDIANQLIKKAADKKVNLLLPTDAVAADAFSNDANTQTVDWNQVPEGWMGLDIGPASIDAFSDVIAKSKTILWNGPMGVFEMSNFEKGTKRIAEAIAAATQQGAYSLIGGGDSVAAINKYQMATKVSYVSTGGGAMLESLEGKILPGVKAILS